MVLAHLRGLLQPTKPSTPAAAFMEMQVLNLLETQETGEYLHHMADSYAMLLASATNKSDFKQLTALYNKTILQGSNYKKLIRGTVTYKAKTLGVDELVEIYNILEKHGVH